MDRLHRIYLEFAMFCQLIAVLAAVTGRDDLSISFCVGAILLLIIFAVTNLVANYICSN